MISKEGCQTVSPSSLQSSDFENRAIRAGGSIAAGQPTSIQREASDDATTPWNIPPSTGAIASASGLADPSLSSSSRRLNGNLSDRGGIRSAPPSAHRAYAVACLLGTPWLGASRPS